MATVPSAAMPLQRVSWLRPKYLLFGFIGLMMAYVLVHNAARVQPVPAMQIASD